ncbi:MAG TPA: glucose-1-phosphate cytidylyltransferase [Burkholderiales bacterium]|jgi:glucose-1-phosphate cytidylyltransferase|nr:glucose-1-phosphate cytidylyltransferase [Burkholderiales bacterium]
MKVVILCGGYGTRIRDVADDIPKPMIPIAGRPILWHIMKYYAHWGHSNFVLCLGYRGQAIKDFFLSYKAMTSDFTLTLGDAGSISYHNDHDESGWTVTLVDTGLNAMTGARVKRIKRFVADDEHFMLTYGDGVGDIDLEALVRFHKSHGKLVTVTGVRPPGRFGEINIDAAGGVTEFNEKPQAGGGRISGGFFVCRREFLDMLSDDEGLVLEQEPMRELVRTGQLMMFEHEGFWQPMDTHREYTLLNQLTAQGKAPWMLWTR